MSSDCSIILKGWKMLCCLVTGDDPGWSQVNKTSVLLTPVRSCESEKVVYAITLSKELGSGNVNVRVTHPLQSNINCACTDDVDQTIDCGMFCPPPFAIFIFAVVAKHYQREAVPMVTDDNSPAQSRLGEKQEISCAESWGQCKV